MAKRTKHTHKYIHQQLSKFNTGWRCALAYCEHFLPRNVEDTIVGRMSVCWGCGEDFKLDEDSVKEEMPKCLTCRVPEVDALADIDIRVRIARSRGIELSDVTQEEINRVKLITGE